MTTQTWITGVSGDWSTAADWSSGVVPSATDDAVININNNSNVVTVNGTEVAHSLTLYNESMVSVGGSLTLGTSLTLNGDQLTLSGGSLSAQSITVGSGSIFGILSGYGTVSAAVSGDIDILANGGTLKVQGSLTGDTGYFGFSSNGATHSPERGSRVA
jgi:hypothetical protein